MGTAPQLAETTPTTADTKVAPFAQAWVRLSKQEHIQLVWDANYWKTSHQRAVVRMQEMEVQHRHELEQAGLCTATLRKELEASQAKCRDLRQRVFGRKTEQASVVDAAHRQDPAPTRPRGQQRGAPGHGRTRLPGLPERTERVELNDPKCPDCGLNLRAVAGSQDSEVLELEVKAYRRVIQRQRYQPSCQCGCLAGIVTAAPPPKLIPKGKFGISVWVEVLLSKFLYGQPTHRLLQDLADHGLNLSQGTLTGGLQALAALMLPLQQAIAVKHRSEQHWHADETRWQVHVAVEGKTGHRWYLWVFRSRSAIHYVLDPSRSARVPETELAGVQKGILSVDRYSAYKKLARLHPGIILAFCWAHQRRDFLKLANERPELSAWALQWVDQIGHLYHLNEQRAQAALDRVEYTAHDQRVRSAVHQMALQCDRALADVTLAAPARKVLKSMKAHWSGLTVFVEHVWLPMDNNRAEQALRTPVVGRKGFYGSGSVWSGQLAAAMFTVLMTVKLWNLNARTWLSAYLQACADNGNRAPAELSAFLPWTMDTQRLAAMRSPLHHTEGIDTS